MAALEGVTIVIPTRDRPAQLRACLEAVRGCTRSCDEILVVDSASRDADAVARVTMDAGARLLRVERKGASLARNAGWRQARHDLILFTDDDCLPQAGWVSAYAQRFSTEGPEVVVGWGPVLVPLKGTGGAPDLGADGPQTAVEGDDVGALGHSANLAVRRSALDRVGGFDALLGAGTDLRASEDKDLLLRLLTGGCRGVLVPDAAVQHDAWRGRWSAVRLQHHYGIGQGALGVKVGLLGLSRRNSFPAGLLRTPLREGLQALRDRYETGAATSAARALGVIRGRWQSREMSVVDGHLQRRGRPRV